MYTDQDDRSPVIKSRCNNIVIMMKMYRIMDKKPARPECAEMAAFPSAGGTVCQQSRYSEEPEQQRHEVSDKPFTPEMDVGQCFFTQPIPTHQLMDPTQPTMLTQGLNPTHPSHTYVKCRHQYCKTHMFTRPFALLALFANFLST